MVSIFQKNRPLIELVSVLMPVYNQDAWLRESIESILTQTYAELELIIVNDGSTDSSEAVILSFDDQRIRYYLREHRGVVQALNEGLRYCSGSFIARMDGDDIALPERLATQAAYLDRHEEVAMVGSYVTTFRNSDLCSDQVVKYPLLASSIKWAAIKSTPFAHPSIMFRRQLYDDGVFYYQESFFPAEDYDLWCRLCPRYKFENIAKPLLRYRIHEKQVSSEQKAEQVLQKARIRNRYLDCLFAKESSRNTALLKLFFADSRRFSAMETITICACFFRHLIILNWQEKRSLSCLLIRPIINKLSNFYKIKNRQTYNPK